MEFFNIEIGGAGVARLPLHRGEAHLFLYAVFTFGCQIMSLSCSSCTRIWTPCSVQVAPTCAPQTYLLTFRPEMGFGRHPTGKGPAHLGHHPTLTPHANHSGIPNASVGRPALWHPYHCSQADRLFALGGRAGGQYFALSDTGRSQTKMVCAAWSMSPSAGQDFYSRLLLVGGARKS